MFEYRSLQQLANRLQCSVHLLESCWEEAERVYNRRLGLDRAGTFYFSPADQVLILKVHSNLLKKV